MGDTALKLESSSSTLKGWLTAATAPRFSSNTASAEVGSACLVSGFVSINLLLFRVLLETPFYSSELDQLLPVAAVLFVTFSLLSAILFIKALFDSSVEDIKSFIVSSEVCEAIGISCLSVAFVIRSYATPSEAILGGYLSSFPIVMFILSIRRILFDRGIRQVKESFERHLHRGIRAVRRLEFKGEPLGARLDLRESWIDVKSANVGDVIRVNEGEIIPCDSELLSGVALVIERRNGGGKERKVVSAGDPVFSGSQVLAGGFDAKIGASFQDSNITLVEQHLYKALDEKVSQDRWTEFCSDYLNIFLIFISFGAGVFWFKRGVEIDFVLSVVGAALLLAPLIDYPRFVSLLIDIALVHFYHLGALVRRKSLIGKLAALKRAAIDFDTRTSSRQFEFVSFEATDERMDEQALKALILAVFSKTNMEPYSIIREVLVLKDLAPLKELRVESFALYSEGLVANVNGVEFSIGAESFLIERGVHIQISDIPDLREDEAVLYIAAEYYVVGRIVIRVGIQSVFKPLVEGLKKYGFDIRLLSQEDATKVDPVGAAMGLELAKINSGLDSSGYIAHFRQMSPLLFVPCDSSDPRILETPELTVSVYDEIRCDISRGNVTLFGPKWNIIPRLFAVSRWVNGLSLGAQLIGTGLLLMGLAGAISGLLNPGAIAMMLLALSLGQILILHLFESQVDRPPATKSI